MSDLVNPTQYGVLATGFSRMRLPEIRDAIIESLQFKTQLTFETRPDSITGQFIDTFAEREAAVWELAEAVYHAMYPISAFGVNLDHSVAFAGVTRLFAEQSTVWVNFYGDEGTIINEGSFVRSASNREPFTLQNALTITSSNCGDVTFTVTTATAGQVYTITITRTGEAISTASYTALVGDTNVSIADNLAASFGVPSNYNVTQDANKIRVYRLDGLNFNATNTTNITKNFGTTGLCVAQEYGPIEVVANDITIIVTTTSGLDSVNNPIAGHIGRNTETDDQLRQRYTYGVYRLGAGTIATIQANIEQNVIGLQTAIVYENNTNATDTDGRSPHSIEVIAYGGDPNAIANEIYRTKPAGIDTYGATTVNINDTAGYSHAIHFSRPTPIYVWVNLTMTKYSEELFPGNGADRAAQIIEDVGNLFGIGKDIIVQRFFGPIFADVPGIATIDIQTAIATTPGGPPGAFSSGNRAIAVRNLSRFDHTRVNVVVT